MEGCPCPELVCPRHPGQEIDGYCCERGVPYCQECPPEIRDAETNVTFDAAVRDASLRIPDSRVPSIASAIASVRIQLRRYNRTREKIETEIARLLGTFEPDRDHRRINRIIRRRWEQAFEKLQGCVDTLKDLPELVFSLTLRSAVASACDVLDVVDTARDEVRATIGIAKRLYQMHSDVCLDVRYAESRLAMLEFLASVPPGYRFGNQRERFVRALIDLDNGILDPLPAPAPTPHLSRELEDWREGRFVVLPLEEYQQLTARAEASPNGDVTNSGAFTSTSAGEADAPAPDKPGVPGAPAAAPEPAAVGEA